MPSTSFPVPSKFPLGPAAAVFGRGETLGPAPRAGGTMKSAEEEHYGYASSNVSPALPLPTAHSTLPAPCHNLQTSTPGIIPPADHPSGYGAALDGGPAGYFLSSGHTRPDGAPALESPRIEITSCLGLYHNNNQFFHDVEVEDVLPSSKRSPSTATLSLPSLEAYRDPSCLSPASSLSSRSCNSEASSYESNYSYPYASPQTSPWQSPCVSPKTTDPEEGFPRGLGACTLLGSPRHSPSTSPRASVTEESWLGARSSRPASPCNKRKYSLNGRQPPYSPHHSPTPSPHGSPRVSVTDDSWLGNTTQYTSSAIVAAINALTTDSSLDLGDGVPVKSRKTTLEQPPSVALKVEPVGEDLGSPPPPADFAPEDYSSFQHIRKGGFCDQYLAVPQHPYQWAKPKPLSPTSYMSPTLPALDWQLPSHSGPYELRIEVQPKSHHRAHYETEGSRGAVKASAGGHPIVQLHGYLENEPLMLQLFIGTADDRLLRPHAFYQVHRITGKTVSTTSHEAILSNTKVLEIPLLPENSMRAVIDCAGILKLRNSDIELRKGETDIGRKNTRVRLVFRVHVPQPSGRTLSLQVASNPIECSQRSAQELPLVEKQSTDSYPVVGGKKMVLSGHNFLQDSKVIFVEKAPDGHHVWEMEAKTDRDLCKPNSLVVEIPPFRNQRITSPVHVSFYVCNGKRKRSQYQRFTYLPANVPIIKTEPTDDYEPAPTCGPVSQGLSPLPRPYYSQQLAMPPDPSSCLVAGFPPCPQRSTLMPAAPGVSPKLHDLSPAAYTKGVASPGHCHLGLPQPAGEAPAVQDVPRPVATHPGSPGQPPPALLPQQVSAPPSSSCPPGLEHSLCPSSPSPPLPPATQEPTCLQPCSPACPPATGRPQHLPSTVRRDESPTAGPRLLPEVHEDGSPNLAPIPVTVKREPEELDQLYLDDVNEIIRNDLSSTSTHS
ncbi:nuclear factor of activated T cells 1 [Homo sapiens]|uniref:Nuclear factor of activated T-cells, cytoplasmic 1 n=4 Tax=Homo sapiens TaxID=9606 RepID=NFAC1_HUMAN|nr:nuclear factor of activated T-cells, cytoplasmic 1 isoform F [Homo sapiens]O95644.3 RecName: Full=Nuclear factor of activated T-cells, cytoplasmic 1; Short=NF-ATc1; Short=NFATc1; AltName: Full=NFAT transcription complex cytosolic component; Short=NF-ATc; Short=NFATc [Homo sapiens]ACG55579.1 nuclear factor of activated T-cells c1 isoform IA-IXL [Homo sapiens]EAW66621.1 nuclear factor of activated T-cells, cytoplasmic, calcineurin-dependent 1, isoform CRA_e [Homo sapiens]KAI2587373.1 nuclear f|eukprot:NP_001265598.1 nuclear factor of activated T-cells, cytoplasmic 1 isoform F [Homo sapiens]